ncbi:MAG: 3-isopropylmalate dehydratase small subunit [Rhodospirillaceae bacterium]|nr:3-isopropylmalate dehydratase small subunit [Rhodospirillaceae bacterium]|tara:strand:- start:772 stop:1389 length:618 start_codon:yes stop_codon:yes gene_type:complete
MQPFQRLEARAASLQLANIDTDQIIPARFLKTSRSVDHGQFLFHDMRRSTTGDLDDKFVLNQEDNSTVQILVADTNFGCGSSRESAIYALQDAGVKCVIAPSFGDIFYNNALKNGLLPISLDRSIVEIIWETLESANSAQIEIDLELQSVHLPDGKTFTFQIDLFRKQCLLEGMDDIDLTFKYIDTIETHEKFEEKEYPWTRLVS